MDWQDYTPVLNGLPFKHLPNNEQRTFKQRQNYVKDWVKRTTKIWWDRIYESQKYRVKTTPFISNSKPFMFFEADPDPRLGLDASTNPLIKITGPDRASEMRLKMYQFRNPFIQTPLYIERMGGNQFSKGPGLSVIKPNPPPPPMDAQEEYELVKKVRFIETTPQVNLTRIQSPENTPATPYKSIPYRRKQDL